MAGNADAWVERLVEIVERELNLRLLNASSSDVGVEDFIGETLKLIFSQKLAFSTSPENNHVIRHDKGVFYIDLGSRKAVIDTTTTLGTLLMPADYWCRQFEKTPWWEK